MNWTARDEQKYIKCFHIFEIFQILNSNSFAIFKYWVHNISCIWKYFKYLIYLKFPWFILKSNVKSISEKITKCQRQLKILPKYSLCITNIPNITKYWVFRQKYGNIAIFHSSQALRLNSTLTGNSMKCSKENKTAKKFFELKTTNNIQNEKRRYFSAKNWHLHYSSNLGHFLKKSYTKNRWIIQVKNKIIYKKILNIPVDQKF